MLKLPGRQFAATLTDQLDQLALLAVLTRGADRDTMTPTEIPSEKRDWMASLSRIDKSRMEKLFRMSGGYVLDHSNRTFAELFADTVSLSLPI